MMHAKCNLVFSDIVRFTGLSLDNWLELELTDKMISITKSENNIAFLLSKY